MMKKYLLFTLMLLMTASVFAVEVEIGGLWYNIFSKTGEAKVIQYKNDTKYSGNIEIPTTVEYNETNYPVTSIGEVAFYDCSGLTSVTIPNSITSIGEDAFCLCSGLVNVYITDLESWCKISFSSFDSTPLNYAHHLFLNGEEVTDLAIPNGVTSIGNFTFPGCSGLTSVTIPNSVTNIGDAAFYECSGLAFVTVPNSVTTIGDNAFASCSGLTSITIGNSVTNIGHNAFGGCRGLTSVTIPNSVTTIGGNAFWGCSGLTSITIGNSVTSIGQWAFSGCTGLTSLVIPNSVTTIGTGAFSGCSELTTIIIGSGVEYIYTHAFANCPELANVYCYAENVPSLINYDTTPFLDAFEGSYINYATLHVPEASIGAYQTVAPWSGFGTIVPLGNYYTLTLTASKGGSIGYSTNQVTNGTGGFFVEEGGSVNLSFTADEGYSLQSVYVNGVSVGTGSLYQIASMSADVTVNATFVRTSDHTTVTIGSTGMATYCPMDDVNFSTVSGLKAYTATGYDHGTLTVSRVLNAPAGTGLLLQGDAGTYDLPYATSTGYYINLLHGLMTDTQVSPTQGSYTNFILGQKNDVVSFYRLSEAGLVAAGKAYLQLPTSVVEDVVSGSRVMRIVAEDETTGIRSVELLTNHAGGKGEELFDLQGRRVTNPSKGLYIVGGQKVVVK